MILRASYLVSPDLVCSITVSGDSVRPHDHRCDLLLSQCCGYHIVTDQGRWYFIVHQFVSSQTGALIVRSGLGTIDSLWTRNDNKRLSSS